MTDEAIHCFKQVNHFDQVVRLLVEKKQYIEALAIWKQFNARLRHVSVNLELIR